MGTQRDQAPAAGAPASLGRLLRTLRERALLTQEELASRAGVSVGTVAGLESGRTRRPRSGSLRLLADALGLAGADRAALLTAYRPGSDLATNPAPAWEPAAGAGRPATRPAQLPADLADFAGRADYLARLDALLPAEPADPAGPADPAARPAGVVICAISGGAGIGKTALAVHWAHRVADRFPDGQLYVNLRGYDPVAPPVDPAEAVRGFLEALGLPLDRQPASLSGQVGAYRSRLADRRVLVVLDNARDAEQVRPLLPGAPGSLAVVTSRNQLTGLVAAQNAQPVRLDLPSTAEARQLLERRLGAGRVAAEPAAVAELIAGCARLPLALVIVAARAATHPEFPLHTLAAELLAAGGDLDVFAAGESGADLRAAFSWSYDGLGGDAARLFRLLGLAPGPELTAAAVAGLAALPPARARNLLAELARAHLLTERAPGRFTFHDLLRAYARELTLAIDPAPERTAAQGRLLDHYLHTACAATMLVSPDRETIEVGSPAPGAAAEQLTDRRQAMAWLRSEQPVLLAAIEFAAGHGFDGHAWRLAWAMSNVLHLRGDWQAQLATNERALAAVRRQQDRAGEAHIHHGLASGYARSGRYQQAEVHYQQAHAGFQELGNLTGQATALQGLGWVTQRQGRHHVALGYAYQALDLYEEAGNRSGQARALNNVGWQSAQLGDYRQALTHCRRALELHRASGDLRGQATACDSLGYAWHRLGEHDRAAGSYRQALELFRELDDRLNEADTLIRLGEVYADAAGAANADPAAAQAAWQRAVTILDQLGHPDTDQVRARLRGPTPTPVPPAGAA